MKFIYTGAEAVPGSGATIVFGSIHVRVGHEFECPARFVDRARRHPHFEEVVECAQEPESEAAEPTKAELIARAETAGIHVDGRWSPARILKEIEGQS